MAELPQYVVALLDNIAKTEGLTSYTIDLKPGSKHGDGFLGVMVSVVLTGSRNQGNTTIIDKLNLICKLAPDNPSRRKAFLTDDVFARETLAYKLVLPLFAKFQSEKGITGGECFNSYPKCYAAICDDEKEQYVIIMEDLRAKGFVMWPKNIPLTAQHSFAIVERLAKFHAVSFALKDQRPEVLEPFHNLEEIIIMFFERGSMGNVLQNSYDRALKALKDEKHIAIVNDLKLNSMKYLKECLVGGASKSHSVLCHGDVWINNLLFHYDNEQVN